MKLFNIMDVSEMFFKLILLNLNEDETINPIISMGIIVEKLVIDRSDRAKDKKSYEIILIN